ncbi:hypothetical protein [Streptomyces sp. TP-A0356]|uniref:hypothetical protein n=1 Tax=Streptomyces sp. TP-A0356 TaxID=1359208 RepID=UPI00131E83C4|nr:hypothetical protein [Streptomyces sp. TP-A0356]
MSRRWWTRQVLVVVGFAAFAAIMNIAQHRSWPVVIGWVLGVVLLSGLAALNVLWHQRYRPEKFEKFRAKAEARYQR